MSSHVAEVDVNKKLSVTNMPLSEWRERIGRHVVHLDFEPAPAAPFRASLKPVFEDGDLRVAIAATSAGATIRDRTLAKMGAPSFDLLIAKQSGFEIEHVGKRLMLRAGDGVILQNWEPGRLTGASTTAYTSVVMPAERVRANGLAAPLAARAIPRDNPALALLRGYLRLLEAQRGDPPPQVADHIFDLALASASASHLDRATESLAAARTAAIVDYIETHFARPGLTSAKAAADLGVSTRYLERLMERSGTSFGRRVLERRLAAAYEGLIAGLGAGERISDLALSCGFSDISYFTRCFRRRFGASPGAMRK